ncbi:putative quinol monooxygenase YgiN [Polystyrenella longa]|uniref:Putative quinol monooxygenase YgiN n=1 Tax=Polystyrenella longa TaxID=2528007 RepID=A0A518CM45_9PLAN|nr:putative quinol monooxygenase [Polystyrenella longa]QDU80292.1 putative quinol monooxygenase YgiN [Polystyrenella longa]
MIHVIATIEVREGQREAFLEQFRQIIEPVRAEEGCLEYGPAIDAETDIPVQTKKGENIVTVVEKWESPEALKAHFQAPHMLEYKVKVADIVTGTRIEILSSAE